MLERSTIMCKLTAKLPDTGIKAGTVSEALMVLF